MVSLHISLILMNPYLGHSSLFSHRAHTPHPSTHPNQFHRQRLRSYILIIGHNWSELQLQGSFLRKHGFPEVVIVQLLNCVRLFGTPWNAVHQASLSITISPELAQTHVHRVGDTIQPFHPVTAFSSRLQSFPASGSFLMSRPFASGGQSIGVSA